MGISALSVLNRLLGAILLVGGMGLWGGCDTVPTPDRDQTAPSVSALQVIPDSIHQSDPGVEVQDSSARVPLDISARATDPDGSIVRVVFLLEPSSDPRGTASGTLPVAEDDLYGGRLVFTVPLVDEIYTVQVFAVDDDSLASNRVTGQFRFVPSGADTTSRSSSLN
jgi:hypothetical protein